MPNSIQVIGLSTINMHEGTQYTILTKTGKKYYDYIFTPNASGKYTLRINPTVDKVATLSPLHPCVLLWQGPTLVLSSTQPIMLYNTQTQVLAPIVDMFQQETVLRPKRHALIINGNPDAILPFLSERLTKTYTDRWEHVPAIIPEDIIILNTPNIPIPEIVLHLPQRTQAVVITPTLTE